jgi:hypothetical protein
VKICWFWAFVFSEGIELGVWVLRMREEGEEERGEKRKKEQRKTIKNTYKLLQ